MIITITGAEGSGKSSLAKRLAKELGWERIYVGGIHRQMAKEMGMTLAEFNKWSETNPEGDIPVDKKVVEEARKLDNAIVEGRVMYHFLPESVKIFLDVDIDEAAKRIYNDPDKKDRNEDEGMRSVEEVKQSLLNRRESDIERYQKYYGINPFDKIGFDLIIDTTDISQDETFDRVMAYIQNTVDPSFANDWS